MATISTLDQRQLEEFVHETAKSIKTEADLDDFRQMLTKVTIETALNAELDEHLGYDKHGVWSPTSRQQQ